MVIAKSQLQKIQTLFREHSVVSAYLFGSQARGEAGETSDFDIAVLLPKIFSKQKRFKIRLDLMRECSRILRCDADIVALNDISSLFFKYVIFKEGQMIYQSKEDIAADFENRVFSEYFDFEPFLNLYNRQYVKHNLQ